MHAAKKDIEDAKECLLAVQKTIATVGHMDIWWVIFQGHIVTCDYHYQYMETWMKPICRCTKCMQ